MFSLQNKNQQPAFYDHTPNHEHSQKSNIMTKIRRSLFIFFSFFDEIAEPNVTICNLYARR